MDGEKKFSNENEDRESKNDEIDEIQEISHLDYDSGSSTDSDSVEKCPICLLAFAGEIGRPQVCQHNFCLPCIQTWSQVLRTCPIDRREFNEINVYDNIDSNHPLRTVKVKEKISINEITTGDEELTPCEICSNTDREDVMLLCDGCDKGFHIDCLNPPLAEIPQTNWFCTHCQNESDSDDDDDDEDVSEDEEVEANTAEEDILTLREQPQILRTMQSERIRNAILARRSLRGAMQVIGNQPMPSTSTAVAAAALPVASTSRAARTVQTRRPPVKKRKTKRRRRRVVKEVVEYGLKDGQKFPIIKTRRVARRKKRKGRKVRKASRRKACTSTRACGSSSTTAGFKSSNANVYGLQRDRQQAGLSNFNIFQPTNQLDYVPDDEIGEDEMEANSRLLTQAIVNYSNPMRRQALIKKRVIENLPTTSSINLIDSILGEAHCFSHFKEKSSGKLLSSASTSLAKQSAGNGTNQETNNAAYQSEKNSTQQQQQDQVNENKVDDDVLSENTSQDDKQDEQQKQSSSSQAIDNMPQKKLPQKKKKRAFDMFEDSMDQQCDDEGGDDEETEEQQPQEDVCPNFSIYDSVNRNSDENLSKQGMLSEENVDLVQMSDDGEHVPEEEDDIDIDIERAVVRSQPASPDLENDACDQMIVEEQEVQEEQQKVQEERSYTPPLMTGKELKNETKDGNSSKSRRDRDHKRHRRRELERYNVRDRFRTEISPLKNRDRFGRNRTRSRSRSRSHNRQARRKSRSHSNNKGEKSRNRRSRSRNVERRRKRSNSRSLSRRRDSSNERRLKKSRQMKKPNRKTKSRSPTPQPPRFTANREKSPRRRSRDRSTSESKTKKRKHRNRSKEKASAHTKEVFKSGQNILVSVNFNNQEGDKRSAARSRSREKMEPIVDITAKKKINVSTKSVVAIIDLARSPFRELTPEYKKEINVIELSDSEGEKQQEHPKSPDSTKLYDPFDILNSPANENVSSSQNASALQSISRDVASDFTNKLGANIIKNFPLIANTEENLVSSSSSLNVFDKIFSLPANKVEAIQTEVVQHPIIVVANNATTISSPYSPGNDDAYGDNDDHHDDESAAPGDDDESQKFNKNNKTVEKEPSKMFDELFGSSSPTQQEKTIIFNKKCKSINMQLVKYLIF